MTMVVTNITFVSGLDHTSEEGGDMLIRGWGYMAKDVCVCDGCVYMRVLCIYKRVTNMYVFICVFDICTRMLDASISVSFITYAFSMYCLSMCAPFVLHAAGAFCFPATSRPHICWTCPN